MSNATPAQYQVPLPFSTSTTGPKVLTLVGLAVLVLSIAIGVDGGARVASDRRTMEEKSHVVDAVAVATIGPGQTEIVSLRPHTSYTLLPLPGPYGSSTPTASPQLLDDVYDPHSPPWVTDHNGFSLPVSTSSRTDLVWASGESVRGWSFRAGPGTYEITARDYGPALQLVEDTELDTPTDGTAAAGGWLHVATGVGIGTVGVGLLIGGAAWWSVRSKNARLVALTARQVV